MAERIKARDCKPRYNGSNPFNASPFIKKGLPKDGFTNPAKYTHEVSKSGTTRPGG